MYAAPAADLIAMIVAAVLTLTYMRTLRNNQKENSDELSEPATEIEQNEVA